MPETSSERLPEEDFNKTHPELQEGEIFFANIRTSEMNGGGWRRLVHDYRTLRLGNRAYNIHGESLVECRPLFVQRDELIRLRELVLFE